MTVSDQQKRIQHPDLKHRGEGWTRKHGDYTGLADSFSRYRAGYSPSVLAELLDMLPKPHGSIDFVDIGAGTGIWTRMVVAAGCRSALAIEPNDDMRAAGARDCAGLPITWFNGTAENTGLDDNVCDLVTMASAFHWVDEDKAMTEFSRILRSNGRFALLWNPRDTESNPLLADIERELHRIVPGITRISSGLSGVTRSLTQRLQRRGDFEDISYLEGRHVEKQSAERYIGLWKSVNDIRVQAGEKRFGKFMDYVESRIQAVDSIDATYLTRLWTGRRKARTGEK